MTTLQQQQNPKISWAQNRRSINISYLIRNNNYGAPSVLFNNDNSAITLQCQGCLPNENPSESVRNFEITLNLFAPVFAIDATDQIKVTEKYIRINLFKKSRKSWEKLINVDEQKKRSTIDQKTDDDDDNSSVSIMNFYGKNHKTAIIYDWDLDAVMERQMKEALEEAGMLDEDFSTSSDGESSENGDNYDDDSHNTKKKGFKSPSSFNTDTGFDGGESGNCSTATTGRVNSLLQNRKKSLKKKTSRVSKDPVYGDHVPTSSSSSSSDSESAGNNNLNNNHNNENNNNNINNSSSDDKMFGPRRPNAKEQQHQQQVQQQKRMQQVALKQMHELNKTLPVGQRRSLTDRQILVLVIGIGAICALIGGFLSASVVYWKMNTVAVSPELIEKVVEKQQQQQQQQQKQKSHHHQPTRTQQKVEQETKVMEKENQ